MTNPVRFRIKEYAHGQGMRLGDLARKLRMPLSNLSAIASGRRSVSISLLSRIARLLNCSLPEMFEKDETIKVYPRSATNARLLEIERENRMAPEKGWVHRLSFHYNRHFQSVHDGGVPYGSKVTKDYDPWGILFERFHKAGVDYVVVGMTGINYYARSASESFGTQDYDLFLRPTVSNAVKAFEVLKSLDYGMIAAEKKLLKKDIPRIVKEKRTILAANPEGVKFEFLFAVSGFAFDQLAGDGVLFKDGENLIRVGKLHKLLASKKAAGREKDLAFLKRYEMLLKEQMRPKPKTND